MLKALTQKLLAGESLESSEMREAMNTVMQGQCPQEGTIAFLTALRDKGETVEEIAAAATVLREHMVHCTGLPDKLVDTCGTGGDKKRTFNISTAAALVAAGAGVPVAKHGNRSVSSKSGSADVLEALGVNIELPPEQVAACIREVGIGFFFAPRYHPAMKEVAAARKAIGTRTIFNLLGPLSNPASAKHQLIGVFSRGWCQPLAHVLARLSSSRVMVVHGEDGMDEITLTGKTTIATLQGGQVTEFQFDPRDYDFRYCTSDALVGGYAEDNALQIRGLVNGYESPFRQVVLLNAAAALLVGERVMDWEEGIRVAAKSIDQGRAHEVLTRWVELSQS